MPAGQTTKVTPVVKLIIHTWFTFRTTDLLFLFTTLRLQERQGLPHLLYRLYACRTDTDPPLSHFLLHTDGLEIRPWQPRLTRSPLSSTSLSPSMFGTWDGNSYLPYTTLVFLSLGSPLLLAANMLTTVNSSWQRHAHSSTQIVVYVHMQLLLARVLLHHRCYIMDTSVTFSPRTFHSLAAVA